MDCFFSSALSVRKSFSPQPVVQGVSQRSRVFGDDAFQE